MELPRNKLVFVTQELNIFQGFLAHSLSKSVSQKARKCSEFSFNILGICSLNPSSKGHSRDWAQIDYLLGASNWTHILLTSRLAWFLQCFHILSFNYQGLSNLLRLLAVRLNELETALIYNNKIQLTVHAKIFYMTDFFHTFATVR